jgi:hypothetical protein
MKINIIDDSALTSQLAFPNDNVPHRGFAPTMWSTWSLACPSC